MEELDWVPDLIVASYHGIPKKYFQKGDPYHCYCQKTTRLISEKLEKSKTDNDFSVKIWSRRMASALYR